MKDFEVEDVVIIYENTPTFEGGTIAQIIDKDPNDNSYAVADLRDIGKADRDINVILQRYVKWVDSQNMDKIDFKKPEYKSKLPYIVTLVFCMSVAFALTLYNYFNHG
jgi:hypothetical protein